MNEKVKLAPSILSADFAHLAKAVVEATKYGADYIHVDVMDGHFVPPITIGHETVKAIRKHTSIPLDVHLMISSPERQLENFARAGADLITVHVEACTHLQRTVTRIRELGARAGVSLNPATPLESITEILPFLDLVVVMTVNPGYGGQSFIPEMLDKIARLRRIMDDRGITAELEADGGIKAETAARVVQAGATVIAAGSAIFNDKDSVAQAMERMRKAIGGAR